MYLTNKKKDSGCFYQRNIINFKEQRQNFGNTAIINMIKRINRHSSLILCLGWVTLGSIEIYSSRSRLSLFAGIGLIALGIIYGIYYFSRKKIWLSCLNFKATCLILNEPEIYPGYNYWNRSIHEMAIPLFVRGPDPCFYSGIGSAKAFKKFPSSASQRCDHFHGWYGLWRPWF